MRTPRRIWSAAKAVDSLMQDPHRAVALGYVVSFAAAGWLFRGVSAEHGWLVLSALVAVPLTPVIGFALAIAVGLFCRAPGIHRRRDE